MTSPKSYKKSVAEEGIKQRFHKSQANGLNSGPSFKCPEASTISNQLIYKHRNAELICQDRYGKKRCHSLIRAVAK